MWVAENAEVKPPLAWSEIGYETSCLLLHKMICKFWFRLSKCNFSADSFPLRLMPAKRELEQYSYQSGGVLHGRVI